MSIDKIFENKYLVSLERNNSTNRITFLIKDGWVFRKELIYNGIILEPIRDIKNMFVLTSTTNESFDKLYSIFEKIILFNETKEEKEKELEQKIQELKKSYVEELKNFTLNLNTKETVENKVEFLDDKDDDNKEDLEDDNS